MHGLGLMGALGASLLLGACAADAPTAPLEARPTVASGEPSTPPGAPPTGETPERRLQMVIYDDPYGPGDVHFSIQADGDHYSAHATGEGGRTLCVGSERPTASRCASHWVRIALDDGEAYRIVDDLFRGRIDPRALGDDEPPAPGMAMLRVRAFPRFEAYGYSVRNIEPDGALDPVRRLVVAGVKAAPTVR